MPAKSEKHFYGVHNNGAASTQGGRFEFNSSMASQIDHQHRDPAVHQAAGELERWFLQRIHPVNNRRILETLRHRFDANEAAVNDWCATWIGAGFDAFEAMVNAHGLKGPFAFGANVTVADVYLVPQIESARRFKVDLGRWPRLQQIDAACGQLDAFQRAAPAEQPDAPVSS